MLAKYFPRSQAINFEGLHKVWVNLLSYLLRHRSKQIVEASSTSCFLYLISSVISIRESKSSILKISHSAPWGSHCINDFSILSLLLLRWKKTHNVKSDVVFFRIEGRSSRVVGKCYARTVLLSVAVPRLRSRHFAGGGDESFCSLPLPLFYRASVMFRASRRSFLRESRFAIYWWQKLFISLPLFFSGKKVSRESFARQLFACDYITNDL